MERETNRNRTLWIILGIILVLACCCILAAAAAAFFFIADRQVDVGGPELGIARVADRMERTFDVGVQPTLEVDDFAGAITIRAGEPGVIRVVATRRAPGRGDMDNIRIEYTELDNGVHVVASLSSARFSNRAVDLDIEVPADARVVVDSGAGQVIVTGVAGELDLHTGAGEVIARDATGGGRLDTGAGAVRYEGEPINDLTLQTGAGEIVIALPPGANVDLDLTTGIGDVDVVGFDVDGSVSMHNVQGSIGTGGPTIEAHTGAGRVQVTILR
ncbi:MAG: hypothetical protein JXA93_04390 [Anaerolineae bacterium]|nr:hypothetical protein [Anaerolineae bacterium]